MTDSSAPVHLAERTSITALELSQFGPAVQTKYLLIGPEGRIDKVVVGNDGKTLWEYAALRKDKVNPDKVYTVNPLPVTVRPDVAPPLPLAQKAEQAEPVPPPATGFVITQKFIDWANKQIAEAGITEDLDIDMARAEILPDVLGITFPYLDKTVPVSREVLVDKFRNRLAHYVAEWNAPPEPEEAPEPELPVVEMTTPMSKPEALPRLIGDESPVVVLFDIPITIDGQNVLLKMTNRGSTPAELMAAIDASVETYRLARQKFPQTTPQYMPVAPPAASPLAARPATIDAPKAPAVQTFQQWAADVQGAQLDTFESANAKSPGEPIRQLCDKLKITADGAGRIYEFFPTGAKWPVLRIKRTQDATTLAHWCTTKGVDFGALPVGEVTIPPCIVTYKKGKEYEPGKFYKDLLGLE